MKERRLPILKFSQDSPQTIFELFDFSKYCHNFTIFRGYSSNIHTFNTFLECSSNILEALVSDSWNLPKDQRLLLSNYALLTQKQLFRRELFKEYFPLKHSLNVPWMS